MHTKGCTVTEGVRMETDEQIRLSDLLAGSNGNVRQTGDRGSTLVCAASRIDEEVCELDVEEEKSNFEQRARSELRTR